MAARKSGNMKLKRPKLGRLTRSAMLSLHSNEARAGTAAANAATAATAATAWSTSFCIWEARLVLLAWPRAQYLQLQTTSRVILAPRIRHAQKNANLSLLDWWFLWWQWCQMLEAFLRSVHDTWVASSLGTYTQDIIWIEPSLCKFIKINATCLWHGDKAWNDAAAVTETLVLYTFSCGISRVLV